MRAPLGLHLRPRLFLDSLIVEANFAVVSSTHRNPRRVSWTPYQGLTPPYCIPPQLIAAMSLSPAATWRIGSLYGFTAVAFGAFGSHGLQRRFPDLPPRSLKNWEIATSYLLVHSVVLLVLASTQRSLRYERYAAPLIAAGAALFSGSIY